MTKLALIVAANSYGGIGINGKLPWRLEGDLAQFRERTLGQVVIIGRLTDESIPRKQPGTPLPGRIVVVVTESVKEPVEREPDYWLVPSFEDAVAFGLSFGRDYVFFAGGKRIYESALPIIDVAFLTCVFRHDTCDTFVDGLDFHARDEWQLSASSAVTVYECPATGRKYPSHAYHQFERRKLK